MIYITGDTHGPRELKRLGSANWPLGESFSKSDYVIIPGDFGLIWCGEQSKEEIWWTEWLDNKPWTTLFVDGNHENFDRLNKLPKVKKFGGTVGKYTDSIYHLRRGEIYNIDNKKIFTFGGAYSTDKSNRTEGIDWWREEEANYREMGYAISNLEKHGNEVDVVITHTCPSRVAEAFMAKNNWSNKDPYATTETFLDHLVDTVKYKKWYFGHWHGDWKWENYRMLYQDVISIEI